MQKLYCYVDETGQDTKGKFFLVVVVIISKEITEELGKKLLKTEREVGKKRARWTVNRPKVRIAYLERILNLKELKQTIFYSYYEDTKDYIGLTANTIIEAIRTRIKNKYQAFIEIDGFNDAELNQVRKLLKMSRIHYKKLRGPRDESLVFIRLADALAGFLRDCEEEQPYTQKLLSQFKKREFIEKLP